MAKTRTVKVTAEEEAAIAAAGIKTEGDDEVPSYTLRADSAFGIRCMIAVRNLAIGFLPRDTRLEIECKLREFDLYEEAHR